MTTNKSAEEPDVEPEAGNEAGNEAENEAESEEGLSEAELERKRRQEARREAKRQKQELARIQKEMRAPTSKWVKIAFAVVVLLVAAAALAGYLIYCSYSVNLQRTSFMEDYQRADLVRLGKYAPAQLRRAEELRQQAEATDGTLSWQQRIAKYREAEEALAQAVTAASTGADAYDQALTSFRILKDEAVKHKLDQYASMLWARVLEAEQSAGSQSAPDFSATLATEKLTQAIDLLKTASATYSKLRDFDAVATQFRTALGAVEQKEWERNVPDAWAALQRELTQAESVQELTDWDKAAQILKNATSMIAPAAEKIATLKAQAKESMSLMEQTMKAAETSGTPAAKPKVWEKATAAAKEARETLAESDYATAARQAGEVTAMLGEAGESVRQAKESLAGTLTQVGALYGRAAADAAFFVQNSAPAWQAVQTGYRRIPEMHRQNQTFELVELAANLKKELEGLLREREQLLADLKTADERLATAAKAPLYPHLARNYPETVEKIDELRRTAARRRDRGEARAARDLLVQAADDTEKMLKDFDGVRATVLQLRTSLLDRQERFQEGIRRFMGAESEATTRSLARIEQLLGASLYVDALALARDVDKVLPTQRYQPALTGTVVDYEKGVMWIADGGTADGGNSGKPLDWYAALRWAAALRFGGFDDWRLPTEEQLRDLTRMPPAERSRLLPNTVPATHWSRIPAIDVDAALAVSLTSGTISREDKRKAFQVRAVREPK